MPYLGHICGCLLTFGYKTNEACVVRCSMADDFPVEHALEVLLASAESWSEAAQQAALDAMQQGPDPP